MTTGDRWQLFQRAGYEAVSGTAPASAEEAFYLAVVAFGHGDIERAIEAIGAATRLKPDDLVYPAALAYLQHVLREGKRHVYTAPEAFSAFIRGGGNVPLYQQVSAALQQRYPVHPPARLLDIGVGDGLALLPALNPGISEITLVEPSRDLLRHTRTHIEGELRDYEAYNEPFQTFIRRNLDTWDIAQATWSMQSIAPAERHELWVWLRRHAKRLLLVEFDVARPQHIYHPNYVRLIHRRFQAGIAEYTNDRSLIAQGFLLPVMFGYFDRTAARTNYEQPRADWAAELRLAGWRHVECVEVCPYWWSPAFLIEARP